MAALIAFVFSVGIATAQAPEAIPYQAVVRNNSGNIIANKSIGLRFSIRDLASTGTIVYQETQTATTNALGLFSVNVGQGTLVFGYQALTVVNWQSGSKFLEIEIDTTGGTTYKVLGTQQLLSVPYALSASNGVPSGTIIAFGGDSIPTGWLACDFSAVSRTTYPALFKAIGINWGIGDGISTFNLPDLRGLFLRGVAGLAGVAADPDVANRIAENANGGSTGNKVGSYQPHAFQGHIHALNSNILEGGQNTTATNTGLQVGGSFYNVGTLGTSSPGNADNSVTTPTSDGIHGTPSISSETRPSNVYVNYIIKY